MGAREVKKYIDWRKVDCLRVGALFTVMEKGGERLVGQLLSFNGNRVTLSTKNGVRYHYLNYIVPVDNLNKSIVCHLCSSDGVATCKTCGLHFCNRLRKLSKVIIELSLTLPRIFKTI